MKNVGAEYLILIGGVLTLQLNLIYH